MRWFFGLVLVIALITGALYGAGRFLLPNTLAVTRTIAIERPRATVFAQANDLRLVREWWPYYNRLDPVEDYSFSEGEPGPGQVMRWRSESRELGNGRMQIVRSEPNQSVATIVYLERANLETLMEITPTQGERGVPWSAVALTVSAQCDDTWVNVPCRYMNLILRRIIERELDSGLAKLKQEVEELPEVDFEGLEVGFEAIEAQPFVFSAVRTSAADQAVMEDAIRQGAQQVDAFFAGNAAITKAGSQIRVTTEWLPAESIIGFRVGYPFEGPAPLSVVGVQIGETPSGRFARVVHDGAWADMGATWAKVDAYLRAHGRRADVLPWGRVLTAGADRAQIELFVPVD